MLFRYKSASCGKTAPVPEYQVFYDDCAYLHVTKDNFRNPSTQALDYADCGMICFGVSEGRNLEFSPVGRW